MKLRRLLSATLALLLVVSILPLGAFAEGDLIGENEKLPQNDHSIAQNLGTITDNGTPGGSNEYAEVQHNDGTIKNNYATVGFNNDLIEKNQSGGVVNMNEATGTIETNEGTVGTKKADGTVNTNTGNFGTVETNKGDILINHENGIVGAYADAEKTTPDTDTGNFGTVETNEGTVLINQEGGTVETNAQGGTIDTNKGTVGKKDEGGNVVDGSGNSGTININDGKVLTNYGTGTIGTNDGTVRFSSGKITTNNGIVSVNSPEGTVGTNNGYVEWNYGTVETNAINGIVRNEPAMDQGGNSITGKVNTNYGTVYDYDAETGSHVTTYGVQIQNTDGGTGTKLLQALETEILKLAGLFQRDGYELVGYEDITPPSNKENSGEEDPDEDSVLAAYTLNGDPDTDTPELSTTDFQAKRPSILSLIWKSIAKPASSGGSGDAGPAVLTRLSADKARVGTLIRCGNVIFKIIEVNDDSIRVATVGMLSQQNQADMMGFLKQYLSAAQIDKFIGQPELLDADEIAEFFGDNRAHIAFYAAKDLFEKN